MSQLHVDETVTLSIRATDVKGNPKPFTPDAPIIWTNSNEAAATMVVNGDGNSALTATLTPVTVGQSTTVTVEVSIGGTVFTATIDEIVVEGPIAGIELVETFTPNP